MTVISLSEIGDKVLIKVKAKHYYSKKYIAVKAGEKYRLDVDLNQYWFDFYYKRSPMGADHFFLNKSEKKRVDTPVFRLCGTINKTEEDHFSVDFNNPTLSISKDGNLHFFANDHKRKIFYFNNWGSIDVLIKRID